MILHAVIDAACVGSMSATLLWGVYCVGSIVRHIRARLTRERQRRERLSRSGSRRPAGAGRSTSTAFSGRPTRTFTPRHGPDCI